MKLAEKAGLALMIFVAPGLHMRETFAMSVIFFLLAALLFMTNGKETGEDSQP